jgi:hypothetical protein
MRPSILGSGVRNALLILLVAGALVAPAAVLAGTTGKGDGTLSVRDGNGKVTLAARGVIFGRIDKGYVTVVDYNPDDANSFEDFGTCDRYVPKPDGVTTVCSGTDLRFRFAAGRFDVRLGGRGINVTSVGKGTGTISATTTVFDPGTYSVNGDPFAALPDVSTAFTLGQPLAVGP